ncbi:MAG TPA: hypothetical protein VFZ00_28765 [Solirubrobacter sp.]|nr:hypothetical protein [Solirubrobacter sp.]
MRRLALGIGAAVLVLAAVIWGVAFLTQDRQYYATTPQPYPLFGVATIPLAPGQRACMDRAVVDQHSEQARLLVGTFGRPAVPLELSLSGAGYRATSRVPADYADSQPVFVAVQPPSGPLEVTICVRNAGEQRVALYASDDCTNSRSQVRVDGVEVRPDFDIVFTERQPVSILERLPVSLQRASAFRFFGVSPVTLWPLLILFVIGVPLAVLLTFVRTVTDTAEVLPGPVPRPDRARRPVPAVLKSPWLWLCGVMLAGLLAAVPYVLRFSEFVVMPDELGYVKQAVWFGQHLAPSTQGDHWFNSFAQLGPLLFAPAYALFATPTAFDVSHVVSAVVFVSTAVPVFLLTRSVTRDGTAAVLAAALSIAVPWLGMTASLMTEPIAYPVFAWALLAMTRALEHPSWKRDVIALVTILVAALARAQLGILVPAFVTAVVVFELSSGGARSRWAAIVRGHWPLAAATAIGVIVLLFPGLRSSLLGTYTVAVTGQLLPTGTWAAAREVLAHVVVGIGGLPLALAAAWVVMTLGRPTSTTARAFAAVALCVGALLVVMTGSFTVLYTSGITDRYLFFIVPVLVVASVALLVERRPGTLAIAVAGVGTGAIIAASDLARDMPSLVTPSQTFFPVLSGRTADVASALGLDSLTMPALVGCLIAVAAIALGFARRRWPVRAFGLGVAAALLFANVVQTGYTLNRTADTQAGASEEFVAGRDWLDKAAPGDAPIGAVLGTMVDPATTPASWWDLVFWNKRLDRLYRMPGAAPDEQAFGSVASIDQRSGRLSGFDERELIVTTAEEKRFRLRGGRVIAERNGFVVWQAPRPYRAVWSLEAENDLGDIGVGNAGTLRVFGDGTARRRELTVVVSPSPSARQGATLRATAGGVARSVDVRRGQTRTLRLPLVVPATGAASVRLDVVALEQDAERPTGVRVTEVSVDRS